MKFHHTVEILPKFFLAQEVEITARTETCLLVQDTPPCFLLVTRLTHITSPGLVLLAWLLALVNNTDG